MKKERLVLVLGAFGLALWLPAGAAAAEPAPVVYYVTPEQGLNTGGETVEITGVNFAKVQSISLGGLPVKSWVVLSKTKIRCQTPAKKDYYGYADVKVTTKAGSSTGRDAFFYLVAKPYWVGFGGSGSGGGVSGEGTDARAPAFAMNPAGTCPTVAWVEVAPTGGQTWIHLKQWNGIAWTGLADSATGTGLSVGGKAGSPALALHNECDPVVVWQDENPAFTGDSKAFNKGEIYVKAWRGGQWVDFGGYSSGGGISNSQYDYSRNPTLVLDSQGYPTVAWEESLVEFIPYEDLPAYWWEKVHPAVVQLRRWNGELWLDLDYASQTSKNGTIPRMKVDGTDQLLVAYRESVPGVGTSVFVRRWTPGAGWGAPESVTGPVPGGVGPLSLDLDSSGFPFVAWSANSQIGGAFNRGAGWESVAGPVLPSDLGLSWTVAMLPTKPLKPVVLWVNDVSPNDDYSDCYLKAWDGTTNDWVELGSSASLGGLSAAHSVCILDSLTLGQDGRPFVTWTTSSAWGRVYLKHYVEW
jgi:hypothetical protein